MPVCAMNASRVGRLDSSFSSTSMYSGQLEKINFLSDADTSPLRHAAGSCRVPGMPQPVAAKAVAATRPRRTVLRDVWVCPCRTAAASGESGVGALVRMATDSDTHEAGGQGIPLSQSRCTPKYDRLMALTRERERRSGRRLD